MDKALREHIRIMEFKLKEWGKHGDKEDIRRTYRHHQVKVRDFQHERLIHLIVTLFFGLLFLFSLTALFVMQLLGLSGVVLLDLFLVVILLITELFYIRHYYALENGVQKLYGITDRLALLIG